MRQADRFDAAWEAFFRAARRARTRWPTDRAGGLTLPQYFLLQPLLDGSPHGVGELAEAAGVAGPTATKMLDGLERTGMVERRPSTRDRRRVEITLTDDGRTACAAARDVAVEGRRLLLQSLPPEEREGAIEVLVRLRGVIEEQEARLRAADDV